MIPSASGPGPTPIAVGAGSVYEMARILSGFYNELRKLDGVTLNDEAFAAYVRLNEKFHQLLCEMCASPVMAREIERVCAMPFASPSGFVVVQANSPAARDMLVVAQDQHRQVLDAIERREGARAESLMREHSRLAQRNLREAVRGPLLDQMPGVRLIRKP